jgi:hypothetical protein
VPVPALPPVPEIDIQDLLDGLREALPGGSRPAPSQPSPRSSDQAAAELLDYLLGS